MDLIKYAVWYDKESSHLIDFRQFFFYEWFHVHVSWMKVHTNTYKWKYIIRTCTPPHCLVGPNSSRVSSLNRNIYECKNVSVSPNLDCRSNQRRNETKHVDECKWNELNPFITQNIISAQKGMGKAHIFTFTCAFSHSSSCLPTVTTCGT